MKVADAVEHMTKAYLHRIIDSFTKDFPKPDEGRARQIIVQNVDELADADRIRRRLSVTDHPYADQILYHHILAMILNQPDRRCAEEVVVEGVTEIERSVIAEAEDPESLQYEDERDVEILRAVLEVAVVDNKVSPEELNLIHRLRTKLGVQERSKQLLLAQLGHFPRAGNEVHTSSEYRSALNDLQKLGVVFYCNHLEDGVYVVPEEIVPGVKQALGIELSEKPWRLLLESLTVSQLRDILGAHGLPQSGLKEERVERIIHAGIQPSEALDALTSDQLYDVLDGLAGANVTGTKDERIQRIIDYFVNLVIKDLPEDASPAETYYEYLDELARRDRENLLTNDVISKDREMDAAFEEGIRYLFEEKLGQTHLEVAGSDHPDGTLEMQAGGDLMMWDTKSKEKAYRFPASHLRQFKRYIRDSSRRVSTFLVIAPEIEDAAATTAARLKSESGADTDVALITAENLKWLAENWPDHTRSSSFDLEVFNATGILDRQALESRMKLFL